MKKFVFEGCDVYVYLSVTPSWFVCLCVCRLCVDSWDLVQWAITILHSAREPCRCSTTGSAEVSVTTTRDSLTPRSCAGCWDSTKLLGRGPGTY